MWRIIQKSRAILEPVFEAENRPKTTNFSDFSTKHLTRLLKWCIIKLVDKVKKKGDTNDGNNQMQKSILR